MKKTIGWILLVISILNLISILVRLSKGDSVGSPLYIIIVIMMFIGGISLINSKKKSIEEKQNLPSSKEND